MDDYEDRRARFEKTYKTALETTLFILESESVVETDLVLLKVANKTIMKSYASIRSLADRLAIENQADATELINAVIGITNASMNIGVVGYRTTGARRFIQSKQAEAARTGLRSAHAKSKVYHNTLLNKHVADLEQARQAPWKTAESIRDAVNRDLKDDGRKTVSSRTIQRWIQDVRA